MTSTITPVQQSAIPEPVEQLRQAISQVDPAALTRADRLALLDLFQASHEATEQATAADAARRVQDAADDAWAPAHHCHDCGQTTGHDADCMDAPPV